jgi:outer membrane protein assembly factor BamD (BamD/ComL family)
MTTAIPSSAGAQVAEERLLLDGARSAFASGDYDKALAELRRHGARFPTGVLAEEREALTVRALAALGNTREADARARAFVAKYPESIMRPAVQSAIAPHADRDGGH